MESNFLLDYWKPVMYDGIEWPYKVSYTGVVKNNNGDFLKPWKRGMRKGTYLAVRLCNNGKKKTVDVHRIVCTNFHDNPKRKPEVHHKDGCKFNPCGSNLEWTTRSENEAYKYFMEAHLAI